MAENSTEIRTASEPASKEERVSDAPPIMDPPVSLAATDIDVVHVIFCVSQL